jgi:hypothetical protein
MVTDLMNSVSVLYIVHKVYNYTLEMSQVDNTDFLQQTLENQQLST